jgi:hypothetical protein
MATYSAVCVNGTFSTVGSAVTCSGTLENREYSPQLQELSVSEINDLSAAVLTFFTVCAVIRFFVRFVANTSPSRGG